ncbi:uncharacterized protein LOC117167076 isoform X3 [Belonocnema kinseyi]|uniref:uncharacterized protein LOC117167076 isoform X3 n=1 Tax=Belonocnema kinseyi TaxID=2817044 RepID=UPI00143D6D1C|nr:uncharacterized protein LOC117167076 isoform X3 [Belonocnema kinseyi]
MRSNRSCDRVRVLVVPVNSRELKKLIVACGPLSKLMTLERSTATMSTRIAERVNGLVISSIESLARISLGQTVLKLIDRILWVVEKSAQWSLPIQETAADENGKSFGEIRLVRPLPWILFFPALIMLRILKVGVNIGAFLIGYPPIQPSEVVKFVQKRRRQLRTIKNNGLKSMRARRVTSKPTAPSEEKSTTESTTSPHRSDSKRKFGEVTASTDDDSSQSEEETLISKVNRLASEDSNDDPDFLPDGYCSSDGTTETSLDDEVSLTEAKELADEAGNDLSKLMKSSEDYKKRTTSEPVQKANPILAHENSGERLGVEISEGQDNFYSPNSFGTEGDLAFYSPISSKSVSPERSESPIKPQLKGTNAKSSDFGNGEVKVKAGPVSSENDISRVSRKDVTNGHVEGKKSANSGKSNHKHRRTNHGNRKKK